VQRCDIRRIAAEVSGEYPFDLTAEVDILATDIG